MLAGDPDPAAEVRWFPSYPVISILEFTNRQGPRCDHLGRTFATATSLALGGPDPALAYVPPDVLNRVKAWLTDLFPETTALLIDRQKQRNRGEIPW